MIVGGVFKFADGQPATGIARWDGAAWHSVGELADKDGTVQVSGLKVFNDELIASGGFDTAGGEPASNIARWTDCNLCEPDITNDSVVDVDDLLAVINGWGECPFVLTWCVADIAPNEPDGEVNVDDLLKMINGQSWGVCAGPPSYCPKDLTFNGLVDVDDVLVLINSWGPCPGPPTQPPCPADIASAQFGGSGAVDVDDLLMVINAWGPCQ